MTITTACAASKGFTCSVCAKEYPAPPADSCTTGYGLDKHDNKVCYSCCANNDRAEMSATGKATLYLVGSNSTRGVVTNWPGSLRFSCSIKRGRHNIARNRYDAWFAGPDGFVWHGVTIGDNTQLCHCKRTREKVA
jgi:hypothetical protein